MDRYKIRGECARCILQGRVIQPSSEHLSGHELDSQQHFKAFLLRQNHYISYVGSRWKNFVIISP